MTRRPTRSEGEGFEVTEQTPRSDKHESIKGTSLHDEGADVTLASDWEVIVTPIEAGPPRFDKDEVLLDQERDC